MGTVWRLSDPAAFDRLRSTRGRARSGALWLAWTPPADPSSPPRVAYAVGRRLGGAVVRNRVRRRLRAAVSRCELPPGDYLLGVGAAAASATWEELHVRVSDLVAQRVAAATSSAAGASA